MEKTIEVVTSETQLAIKSFRGFIGSPYVVSAPELAIRFRKLQTADRKQQNA
jgi:hypothetical protein